MKRLVMVAALTGMVGCANAALPSELGRGPAMMPAAYEAWSPPTVNERGLDDGEACRFGTDCRSGYCAANLCQHTDVEDAPTGLSSRSLVAGR